MDKKILYKILGIIFMLLILGFIIYPVFYTSPDDELDTNTTVNEKTDNMLQIDILSNLSFFKILVADQDSEHELSYNEQFVTIRDTKIVEQLQVMLSTAKLCTTDDAMGYGAPTIAICYLEDNSMYNFFVADSNLVVFSDSDYNKTMYKLDSQYDIGDFLTKLYNTNVNSYAYSIFQQNEKYGIKYKNKIIIQPEYDDISLINSKIDVFAVTQENITTFIDKAGEDPFPNLETVELIPGTGGGESLWYENALKFKIDEKFGLISLDGSILLPVEYDNITALNYLKDYLIISQNGKEKVLKLLSSGYEEITGEFDSIKILGADLDFNSSDEKYLYTDATILVGINNGIREQYFEIK